jgi:hypothetical protein
MFWNEVPAEEHEQRFRAEFERRARELWRAAAAPGPA